MIPINKLKIGQKVFTLDDNNIPDTVIIKNIDIVRECINYCECEECKKREGTEWAHWKFDHAINIHDIYETLEEVEKIMYSTSNHNIHNLILKLKEHNT